MKCGKTMFLSGIMAGIMALLFASMSIAAPMDMPGMSAMPNKPDMPAPAAPPHHGPGGKDGMDPAQHQKFEELRKAYENKIAPLRDQMWGKMTELRALQKMPSATRADVQSVIKDVIDLRAGLRAERSAFADSLTAAGLPVPPRFRGVGGRPHRPGGPMAGGMTPMMKGMQGCCPCMAMMKGMMPMTQNMMPMMRNMMPMMKDMMRNMTPMQDGCPGMMQNMMPMMKGMMPMQGGCPGMMQNMMPMPMMRRMMHDGMMPDMMRGMSMQSGDEPMMGLNGADEMDDDDMDDLLAQDDMRQRHTGAMQGTDPGSMTEERMDKMMDIKHQGMPSGQSMPSTMYDKGMPPMPGMANQTSPMTQPDAAPQPGVTGK